MANFYGGWFEVRARRKCSGGIVWEIRIRYGSAIAEHIAWHRHLGDSMASFELYFT